MVTPTRFRSAGFVRAVMGLSCVAALPMLLCGSYAACKWRFGSPLPRTGEPPYWLEVLGGIAALSCMAMFPGLLVVLAVALDKGRFSRGEKWVLFGVAAVSGAGAGFFASACGIR